MSDEDALQALAYANLLLEERWELEQRLLAADPGYTEFLIKVERENAESKRHDPVKVPSQRGLR